MTWVVFACIIAGCIISAALIKVIEIITRPVDRRINKFFEREDYSP